MPLFTLFVRCCLGFPTAVYSIIYSAVNMLMVDRTHAQNINTEVVIFTKKKPLEIIDYIVNEYHRDATWWEAKGGYTEENTYMVIVVLSKYECAHLKRELKEVDEHAFVVVKDGCRLWENTKSIYNDEKDSHFKGRFCGENLLFFAKY